jgi:Xaa-Pro aminopeptidase
LIWKTELELRWIIISKIFEFGGEGESFESIVAFGENSAIPHHKTWNTKIGNWVLLIDMWALYNWYCSDFTRTFWVWEKNEQYKEFQEIYKIVKQAHINAFNNTKSWMTWKEIDALTRDYISKKWYWDNYIHWTWHWLWLDIHEPIWINSKSESPAEDDMFFTIEPWIYLPWKFWIRLEDIVFMEDWSLKKYSRVGL